MRAAVCLHVFVAMARGEEKRSDEDQRCERVSNWRGADHKMQCNTKYDERRVGW